MIAELDGDVMDAEEMKEGKETGAMSPAAAAAAALSTNATAFCIASLIGDDEFGHGDLGPLRTEENEASISDSGADSNDNASESKITSESSFTNRKFYRLLPVNLLTSKYRVLSAPKMEATKFVS